MITTVLENGPSDVPTFAQVTVKTNQEENRIVIDYLEYPSEIYAYEVCDNPVNPDTIIGYNEGDAILSVHIQGSNPPSSQEYNTMIREFFLSTGFRWTSRFDHDVLSEVYCATEI